MTNTADDVVIPALIRAARGAYSWGIRTELAEIGIDDVPRNGPFLLGGMGNHGIEAGVLIRQLGVSKQAASQLVDTLVIRGYLTREVNADDRRRVTITLTDRGREAAAAVRRGVLGIDAELERRCTAEQIAGLRAGLVALIEIREDREDEHRQRHATEV